MGRLITINYNNKPLYNISIEHDFNKLPAVLEGVGSKERKLCIVTDSSVGAIYLDTVYLKQVRNQRTLEL